MTKNINNKNINKSMVRQLIVFFLVMAITYIFITSVVNVSIKFSLVFILLLLISMNCKINTQENFGRTNNDVCESNKLRGQLGNFYVDCHKCGRERLIQEKEDLNKECDYNNEGNYCKSNCKDKINNSMSFYNNAYIDKNQINCYNCLLDEDSQKYMRNMKNFPYVNGPPGTNYFTH